MRHRRHAAGALGALCLAAAGVAAAAWALSPSDGGSSAAVAQNSAAAASPTPAPPRQSRRVVLANVSGDEWVRIPVPGLVRDRVDPVRLRLYVAGDSTSVYMGESVAALARGLNGVVAGVVARASSGLSRPDFFDWPGFLKSEMDRTNPNVVVVMFGANDPQGLITPQGLAVQPLSEAWQTEYARRVAAMMDVLAAPGRLQVWVGQAVMEPFGFNEQLKVVDRIYAEQAAARKDAVYLDTYSLFATPAGAYRDGFREADGSFRLLRAADGIHFTTSGGQYLATTVMVAIRRNVELITD